jgi:ribosomal protein S18 acetylase RimI-like enzyme
VEILRVRPGEWRALKAARLRALARDASAFASRYDEVAARPDDWWREWAARSADGEQAIFLVWNDGQPTGMAGTFVDGGRRFLFGMWVDPSVRRTGLGRALINRVSAFAREAGDRRLFLEVRADNSAARLLYEAQGFTITREGGEKLEMALNLL